MSLVQKKRVARVLFFKIRPSQEILKIRDGTPLEAEEILTYIKCPRNGSVCYSSSKLDVSSNVVQKKKVARILFFKIRSSQGILKVRDCTPMELDVSSNVVQKKRVVRILFFKIRPSQEIVKIRDGTPLEAEEILTYIKCPRNGLVCYFSSKLDVSSNVVQKKKVARILFFKIRSSQGILKIRDGAPMEMSLVQKKRVARVLFFKIRPSQEILKIRDGTPLEAEEILTYIKCHRNGLVCYFSSKLDVSSNVVQKKKVARILFFKIRSSQGILKIRDGAPMEMSLVQKKRVARVLFFKIRPSQEILKIRDGTPLEAEEILTYIKCPRNGSVCYSSSKLDVSSNVVQKKKVARILFFKIRSSQGILKKKRVVRILFFKIRPSQEILKIRDGTPLEAEEILTYIKCPRNGSVCYFSSKLDVSSNVVQKKKVAEEILTYIKCPRNGLVCYFSSKLDVSSNVVQKKKVARILFFKIRSSQGILKICDVQKKRVARVLFFKIRPSQEILKIRDGTPLEAEEILTYIKCPRNGSVCYFSSKLDVSSNVVQKKKVARILFFKIKPSQEILKIRDGTPFKLDVSSNVVQKKKVARILFFKIRSSQGILKICDGAPMEMPSQEILKIRDGTPLEAEEILTYIKCPRNGSSGTDYVFKIRPSQEILKIRDGTPLEAEEILTYIKCPRNGSVCYFSSKLDVSSNVVQKKKVARILFFKIKPSQEILKIRDGMELDVPSNVVQKKRVARVLFFKIRPSQEILKIRDGTPLEAEEILTYIKCPRNGSVCYFSSKLDVSSNVVQKKKVARILFFKIKPSQEILKIRDGTPFKLDVSSNVVQKKKVARILFFKIRSSQGILKIRDGAPMEMSLVQNKRVARVLFFKIRPSQEILKIRDGTPLEAEEILTYIKCPRNGLVCYFSSKLDVSSNVVQKKKVARILFFKIRSSQGILKIRDGAPMEMSLVQKKRVARVLFFKIRPSQEILKIRDGTPLEAEEILTYIKCPRNGSVCYSSSKLDVSSNVVQKKKVARILFFKIRSSQGILKVRDCTPMEAE
ncbi:hypothetical protein OROMI_024784 [Orobanche minor]